MMKKSLLTIAIIGGMLLLSCNKNSKTDINSLDREISTETETFKLKEAGFSINELEPLSGIQNDRYTSGVLQYAKNGLVVATFDFADNIDSESGKVVIEGKEKECGQGHYSDWDGKGKKKWKKAKSYKKVVVEPIVKTDDCDYIVSGIIKYYSLKSGDFLASVDFGDGTCDDLAIKTKADGSTYQFNISEYFK